MREAIVGAIVGALATWLMTDGWKKLRGWRRPKLHPLARLRRWGRLRRLRAGRYVERLTIGETQDVMENPGLEKLHPQVRADIEEGSRKMAEAARGFQLPTFRMPRR